MKFFLPKLKLGQKVKSVVVEVSGDGSLIVNFSGDLIRVVNQTQKSFSASEPIELIVESLQPLQFKIHSSPKPSSFDLEV